MTRKRIRATVAPVVAAAVLAVSLGAVSPAAAAPSGYLALGDSYAAGQDIDGHKGTDAGCLQSSVNYPSQVATNLGLTLTDNTCSGAVLGDVFATSTAGRPAQAGAPGNSVGTITLTMGANDLGLSAIASSCIASSASGPLTSGEPSCAARYSAGGENNLASRLATTVLPHLTSTLTQLRSTYPSARILVVGYLPLTPDAAHTPAGGCFSRLALNGTSFPFVTTDLEWLNSVQRAMDAQYELAAEASGAQYLSLMTAAADHTACSASNTPYINPLTITGFSPDASALHPNSSGLKFLGQAVTSALNTQQAFGGVRGQLIPQGGDEYELQILVPGATLSSTPTVTAWKNESYLAHVQGEFGWYLGVRAANGYRVYSQTITMSQGDVVELKTADGSRQVLSALPTSFRGVTGQVVHISGNTYELQIWVPVNTLETTPDISARINGDYAASIVGQSAYYLQVRGGGGYRVYTQLVTLQATDTVTLTVTGTNEQQRLS